MNHTADQYFLCWLAALVFVLLWLSFRDDGVKSFDTLFKVKRTIHKRKSK